MILNAWDRLDGMAEKACACIAFGVGVCFHFHFRPQKHQFTGGYGLDCYS